MTYDELLDKWAEKVFVDVDKCTDKLNLEDLSDCKRDYIRGYRDGLCMASAILSRLEKRYIK